MDPLKYSFISYFIALIFILTAFRLYSKLSRSPKLHTYPIYVIFIIFGVADIACFHIYKVVDVLHMMEWTDDGEYILNIIETLIEPILIRFQLTRVAIYSLHRYLLTIRPTYTIAYPYKIREAMVILSIGIPLFSLAIQGFFGLSQHSHKIVKNFALLVKNPLSFLNDSFVKKGIVHLIMTSLLLISNSDLLFYVIYRPEHNKSPAIEKSAFRSLIAYLSILIPHFLYAITMMGMDWMIPLLPFIKDLICIIPFFATWYSNPIITKKFLNRTFLFFGREIVDNSRMEMTDYRTMGGRRSLRTISIDSVQMDFEGNNQSNRADNQPEPTK